MDILHQFNHTAEEQLSAHAGKVAIRKTLAADVRLPDGGRQAVFELTACLDDKLCRGYGGSINEAIEDCLKCLTSYSGEHRKVVLNENS